MDSKVSLIIITESRSTVNEKFDVAYTTSARRSFHFSHTISINDRPYHTSRATTILTHITITVITAMAAAMTEAITEILTQIDRIVDILRNDDRGNTRVALSTRQAQSRSFLKALDRAYEDIHGHPPIKGNTNAARLELLLTILLGFTVTDLIVWQAYKFVFEDQKLILMKYPTIAANMDLKLFVSTFGQETSRVYKQLVSNTTNNARHEEAPQDDKDFDFVLTAQEREDEHAQNEEDDGGWILI
jgi:hypothetical protein